MHLDLFIQLKRERKTSRLRGKKFVDLTSTCTSNSPENSRRVDASGYYNNEKNAPSRRYFSSTPETSRRLRRANARPSLYPFQSPGVSHRLALTRLETPTDLSPCCLRLIRTACFSRRSTTARDQHLRPSSLRRRWWCSYSQSSFFA